MQSPMIPKTQRLSLPPFTSRGMHSHHIPFSGTPTDPFSSHIYRTFDQVLLLSHGRALYCGDGGFLPVNHFAHHNAAVPAYPQGYNIADYLLEIASEPPLAMFQVASSSRETGQSSDTAAEVLDVTEKGANELPTSRTSSNHSLSKIRSGKTSACATTFLTQLQVMFGREWKILRRSVCAALDVAPYNG